METSKEFQIRCSAIGQIMTNPKTKSEPLSKTCITYIHKWIKELPEFYGRQVNFNSKYCDKGNECEQASIDMASDYFGWGMVQKNEEWKSNGYINGTCDLPLFNKVVDFKNSWSQDTFPLFEIEIPDKQYEWQGQGYMELWKKDEFSLIYTLMDAPEFLIEREARSVAFKLGMEDVPADLYDEVYNKMVYSNVPDKLRIKSFDMEYDKSAIESVYQRVEDCRKFIKNM